MFLPGMLPRDSEHIGGSYGAGVKQEAGPRMEAALASTKFSKRNERAAREFVTSYKHRRRTHAHLGPWVGMATHDVGADSGPLRAGMVFTIAPALVVPEEKIYVRLEDMISSPIAARESFQFPARTSPHREGLQEEECQRYPRSKKRESIKTVMQKLC